jgi:hypothetical protein
MPDSQGNAEDRNSQGNTPKDAQGNESGRLAWGEMPKDVQGTEQRSGSGNDQG